MNTTQQQQYSRPSLSQDTILAPTLSFIEGQWVEGTTRIPVLDKYTGEAFAEVSEPSAAQVMQAVRGLRSAVNTGAPPPHARAAALRRCVDLLERNRKRFIDHMVAEAGFTIADATTDFNRSIVTLTLSAEEATRVVGEQVCFAASPGQHNRLGFTIRVPLGIICAITPFNSPLNTVLHKVAPSLAGGNAVILKPAAYTPLSAALLVEVLLEAGIAPEFISLIQGRGSVIGNVLLNNQDIDFYAFTGSTEVGTVLQQAAGLRKTQLELGSIASTIVCNDANLAHAVPKITNAAFRKAGQVCTSIQRLYVQNGILDRALRELVREASRMPAGDPRDPQTRVGPMISESAAERAESWLQEAVEDGAQIVCGGQRSGSVLPPTIVTNVKSGMKVLDQEIFAPVMCVIPFQTLEEAIAGANDQPYGLAAGIFTNDIHQAIQAATALRFGAVHINESSSSRADGMPYGGIKASGHGMEGPKYTIREVTEERLVTITPLAADNS
jgi:succinate-semialdehyde dehydrogenase/glutarate-semialdehyde dehydrogenase